MEAGGSPDNARRLPGIPPPIGYPMTRGERVEKRSPLRSFALSWPKWE